MINVELFLAYLTLLSHIGLAVFLFLYLDNKNNVLKYKKYFLGIAFLIVLFGTLGSLFYSEIMNYPPCDLCWYQRVFMYPLLVIFGVGLIKKDKSSLLYAFPLVILGIIFSGYHYAIQFINKNSALFCDITEKTVSCTENFFTYFYYINLPGMSLTAFVLIFILMILSKK